MGDYSSFKGIKLLWPLAIAAVITQAYFTAGTMVAVVRGLHGGVLGVALLQTVAHTPSNPPIMSSSAAALAATITGSEVVSAASLLLVAAASTR